MKKSVTIFTLVFIVVTFTGAMYYLYSKNAEDPVVYETAKASTETIIKKTVATGSILPLEEVLSSQIFLGLSKISMLRAETS